MMADLGSFINNTRMMLTQVILTILGMIAHPSLLRPIVEQGLYTPNVHLGSLMKQDSIVLVENAFHVGH